jgi:hypothetical protein
VVAALVLAGALGLAACDRIAELTAPGVPPPRSFMHGGAWFPAATGYWLHQYAELDELTLFMGEIGFACGSTTAAGGDAGTEQLRCERSFRLPGGVLSRTDTVELKFRRNGAVEFAESGCRYAFFDSRTMSGTCEPFAAPGAVYPDVTSFAQVVDAMLREATSRQPISMYRLQATPPVPLRDADAAVELLTRWRFECDVPGQRYGIGFRGKSGELSEASCRQFSLRTPGRAPQRQLVIIRYDSVDLAVLGVEVRLDDATAALSQALNTRTAASGVVTAPRLLLETRSGEKFEMPNSAVGTGSREATREGFESLTPASQRELLKAYLEKRALQWGSAPERLSYLSAGALEWYGPEALAHLAELISDERPVLGAALLKYLCFETVARSEPRPVYSLRSERLWDAMRTCIDRRRAEMPRSLALMDQLLARDLRSLEASDARALNAFFDFRRDALYAAVLGPDAKEAGRALAAVVAGKDGLSPELQELVTAAIAGRDRRTGGVP